MCRARQGGVSRRLYGLVPAAAGISVRNGPGVAGTLLAHHAHGDGLGFTGGHLAVALCFALLPWPLLPATGLALWIAWADCAHAKSARTAARELAAHSAACPGRMFFTGHWGFQFYMESFGAQPLPFFAEVVQHGDWIV